LPGSESDLGHLLKNVVYLDLIRRGYKVSIRKLVQREIDFVARDTEGIEYYQVSASVLDKNTLQRELKPLQKIPDHYQKYLLTLDDIMVSTNFDGICHINLIE